MGAQRRRAAIRESAGGNVATAIDGAIERAEAALVGNRREKAAESAGALVEEAVRVELRISNLKRGARSTAAAWADRRMERFRTAG